MNNLRSIFSRDTGVQRPVPPTLRDMIDDIDSAQKNDPIFLAGKLIRAYKKEKDAANHSRSDDVNVSLGGSDDEKPQNDEKKSHYFRTEEEREIDELRSEIEDRCPGLLDNISRRIPCHGQSEEVSPEAAEGEIKFRRFKYLLSICEQSQELYGLIEPKLEELKAEMESYKNGGHVNDVQEEPANVMSEPNPGSKEPVPEVELNEELEESGDVNEEDVLKLIDEGGDGWGDY